MVAEKLSVVIGYRDWGLDRLLKSIKSIRSALQPDLGEVIVSDYGSLSRQAEIPITKAGAKYVYTPTDGSWSRSRALNAGFACAVGDVLVSTDADMLFTPESFVHIASIVRRNRDCAAILQCRDLPQSSASELMALEDIDWTSLERIARVRPRWGMGGMVAVPREYYDTVRGLDERMHTYGGEDTDFALRLRRAGLRIHWIEDPRVRIYHMWHPPTRALFTGSVEARSAIDANSQIVKEDDSMLRNLLAWRGQRARSNPLVSVVIATKNRSSYLVSSIESVLVQTFQDFEIVVVDDGSSDDTESVVKSFDDPRIVYVKRPPTGIAAARNHGNRIARGQYIAVHDDDDLMLPWRLEAGLSSFDGTVEATYGAWIDFNDSTGELSPHPGNSFSLSALLYRGRVFPHPTLMIRTDVVRRFGYDERLRGGSDYNLALRMARSGVRMRHSGKFHIMRRLHPDQVTELDHLTQSSAARITSAMVVGHLSREEVRLLRNTAEECAEMVPQGSWDASEFRPFLPDHLVRRGLMVNAPIEYLRQKFPRLCFAGFRFVDGNDSSGWWHAWGVTWPEIAHLRTQGFAVKFMGASVGMRLGDTIRLALQWAIKEGTLSDSLSWVQGRASQDEIDATSIGATQRRHLEVFDSDGQSTRSSLFGFHSLPRAMKVLASIDWAAGDAPILIPANRAQDLQDLVSSFAKEDWDAV